MLCILIGLLNYTIYKFSCRSQYISVLTICTFMFRLVSIIEPLFFNATSGVQRLPIELLIAVDNGSEIGMSLSFHHAFHKTYVIPSRISQNIISTLFMKLY